MRRGIAAGRAVRRHPAALTARRVAMGVAILAMALALATPAFGQSTRAATLSRHDEAAQSRDRAALAASLDSAAAAHAAKERVAGVSVAVVQGGDTLLMKGYGYVDLEWKVPTPEDGRASYEIGSMTKQFTAAAILQLVERGKLDLDADVTEYLPDFDSRGHAVPVRRLLDHTSGIKGYTEMPVFGELAMKKLPRDTLLSLVEAQPFDFEPGAALIYNNTAYFMLGLIIEKVSGQPYEKYVKEHLFGPVGMTRSYYCSERAIRPERAHGYDATPDGLVRKGYLDHTWPYAAGSLCSTVGDLVRWNQALHGGRVLSAASYHDMITPRPLEDGTPTRYAMGLGVTEVGGRRTIAHGGGINGFLSDGRYYPDDDLIVIVLQNSTGPEGPDALGRALATLVLGPVAEPVATPYDGDLDELVGEYSGPARGRTLTLVVARVEDGLVVKAGGSGEEQRLRHLDGLTWSAGRGRVTFVRRGGSVVAVKLDQVSGLYVLERSGG